MTTALPLMKNVLTPLAKSILVPLGLTAAASSTDAAIQKIIYGSECFLDVVKRTTQVLSNEDLNNIVKIVKSFDDADLLIKGVTEAVENEVNEQKGGHLSMLAATLGGCLLGNMLTGKRVIQAGEGTNRAGWDN